MTDQIRAPWATEPATVTDPEWLRQQYAAAVQPLLMDVLPKPIAAARAWEIVDTILFVRDRHLAQLRQRLDLADADLGDNPLQARLAEAQQNALALDQGREELFARIARVRALHQPDPDGRTGYQPDDDNTPGAYGDIAQACRECGSSDLAVRWPCPTIQALDTEAGATP